MSVLYVLGRDGLVSPSLLNTYKYIKLQNNVLTHKTYSIPQNDDFLEWKNNHLSKVFDTLVAENKGDKEEVQVNGDQVWSVLHLN